MGSASSLSFAKPIHPKQDLITKFFNGHSFCLEVLKIVFLEQVKLLSLKIIFFLKELLEWGIFKFNA